MTEKTENFVIVNNRKLRTGHTTGTCAAAASKAAAEMLFSQTEIKEISITTPKGITLRLNVEEISITQNSVKCAVRKDGGDDIDVTHESLVFSTVSKTDEGFSIEGGKGVGRVTRKGLDQPVGNAAINRVPRRMITEAVQNVIFSKNYKGGISIIIEVPDGEELADKTFNPRLGIQGGISILGTSGIVEPMSETALIDTIKTEMNVRTSDGQDIILVVPGNYGKDFVTTFPDLNDSEAVKCSNFIGEMLDFACSKNVDVLLVGNLGKLVKLAGGIMNTHSRNSDSRMEILTAHAATAGASSESLKEIMNCITTDDALEIIDSENLIPAVSKTLVEKIEYHMNHRTEGRIQTSAIVFSSTYGLLGKTSLADEHIKRITEMKI